ncbi:MAG TPA: TauD/TfdA family dioxygenase [Solirubrobacteraceae bacterium]|jgi:L-asparagine oxygenase|nr:TauD/TfdA family dioxygenase [Solirubrobacteraceae bacterium]
MDSTLNAPAPPITYTTRAPDVVELSAQEIGRLLELAGQITASPSENPELFCREASRMARRAPDRIIELLYDFAMMGTSTGTMLFSKVPVEEPLPETPPDNTHHLGETTPLARVQAIVNHACGQMLGYEAEGYGRLYQDMVPNRKLADSQTSLGSKVELELHTEQAFSKLRPDVLSLACLRGHLDAKTYVLPAHLLLEHMTPAEQELLREPLWTTTVDGSFKMGGHEFLEGDLRGPMPIIAGALDDPSMLFDQDLMRGVTDEAEAIIKRVIEIYQAHRNAHTLAPGEILLVDNHRAVHGRSPFTPRFDGTDRFIIRSFAVRDFGRTRYARAGNGRVVAAEYS